MVFAANAKLNKFKTKMKLNHALNGIGAAPTKMHNFSDHLAVRFDAIID